MAKFAVTRDILDTGTGTQDFVISGFGTPTAAIVMATYAVTDDTLTAHNGFSFGVCNSGQEWAIFSTDEDGQTTTDSGIGRKIDSCLIISGPGLTTYQIECAHSSFTADTLTLNIVTNDDSQPLVTVVLISGTTDIDVSSFSNNSTTPVDVELGYEPDLVFSCFLATGSTSNADLIHSIGVAHNDTSTVQKTMNFFSRNGQATATVATHTSTDKFWLKQDQSATPDYSGAITFSSSSPNGFTSTPTGDPATTIVYYMALKFTDATNIKLVEYDSPGSTGSDNITGAGFTPDFGMLFMSAATVRDSTRSTDEDGWGIAAFSGSTVYSNTASSDDGVNPTVCKCMSSDQLRMLEGTGTDFALASFTGFNADGAEFNYSTQATVGKWFALFTSEGGAAAPLVLYTVPGLSVTNP